MEVKTWDMLREESSQKMGKDLGPLFINLKNQLHDIEWKWNEYVVLFGAKESRIHILNTAAPSFFGSLQDTLFSDSILHITRITDSPKSAGQPNLTIRRLPEYLKNNIVRKEVETLIDNAMSTTVFCRDWRNKRIAHADLAYFTNEPPEPLKEATREKVAIALASIREVLSRVSQEFLDCKVHPVSDVVIGGALDLLYKLDDANQCEKERQERVDSGNYRPSDLKSKVL